VTVDVEDFQRFQGGRSWMARAGILGAIGLIAALVGLAQDPQAAQFSYLVAFAYWAGIAIMSLLWVMIFHAFHAKWMTVIRRPFEAMASTLPLFVLLFIPVAIGLFSGKLYAWVHPENMGLNAEQAELMHNKHGWLNTTFFVARTAVTIPPGAEIVPTVVTLCASSAIRRPSRRKRAAAATGSRRMSIGVAPAWARWPRNRTMWRSTP